MSYATPYYQPPASAPSSERGDKAKPDRYAVRWAAFSLRGARGGTNQDAVLINRPPGFFAVADGVGGGSHGEIASQVALDILAKTEDLSNRGLKLQLQKADAAVATLLVDLSDIPGATTLAVLWLKRYKARLLWVGDVRALHFRAQRKRRWRSIWRSPDQTYAAMGETPPDGGEPEDPARMVGTGMIADPGLRRFRLKANDIVLLCSDGLHRHVSEELIATIITTGMELGNSLEKIARMLGLHAQRSGSMDDISVVLLHRPAVPFRRWLLWVLLGAIALWGGMNQGWLVL